MHWCATAATNFFCCFRVCPVPCCTRSWRFCAAPCGSWRCRNFPSCIQAENEGLDTELHLTISVGGVHGQGRVRDLILQADTALYKAKIKKDCVVVYEEDANEAE